MIPKISIIVPIYRVEPYLARCIDSILSQSFTNYELILVNDGSPDNCGNICEQYAKKDIELKYIIKKMVVYLLRET
jgi:glycosyltransferase involved in cell wall biosynthesis